MLLFVIILTYNEAANLPNAEIFIIDSRSSDNTVEIAEQFGCQVFTNPFENQASKLIGD